MAVESQKPQEPQQPAAPTPKTPAEVLLDAKNAWHAAQEHLDDVHQSAETILNQLLQATISEHTACLLDNLHVICEVKASQAGEDADAQQRRLNLTVYRAIERAFGSGICHQMRLRATGH